MSIDIFEKILRCSQEGDESSRQLILEDLGIKFKDFEFGKLILSGDMNDVKLILNHPLFEM